MTSMHSLLGAVGEIGEDGSPKTHEKDTGNYKKHLLCPKSSNSIYT